MLFIYKKTRKAINSLSEVDDYVQTKVHNAIESIYGNDNDELIEEVYKSLLDEWLDDIYMIDNIDNVDSIINKYIEVID